MIDVNTADLTDLFLDWAVAIADGQLPEPYPPKKPRVECYVHSTGRFKPYAPSKNWLVAGPIIEAAQISVTQQGSAVCRAFIMGDDGNQSFNTDGKSVLEAAMRCYVLSKIGEVVQIPEELLKSQNPA